ncbi:MAG: stage II sporulation protein P [Oscillospiraceae bacterium]|nr:stage II sporulation protein P [Oscillospiraceae bacterium]
MKKRNDYIFTKCFAVFSCFILILSFCLYYSAAGFSAKNLLSAAEEIYTGNEGEEGGFFGAGDDIADDGSPDGTDIIDAYIEEAEQNRPSDSGSGYETPQDIIALMADAEKTVSDAKKKGKITERTYTSKDSTNTYKNVSVRNATSQKIDVKAVLNSKLGLKVPDNPKPAVLIFHTHTSESFMLTNADFYSDSFPTNSFKNSRNMVRIGEEIAGKLEEARISVIHDTVLHDEKYTGAYDHSRKTAKEYLKKYPSVKVCLDVHRDSIQLKSGTRIKPAAEIGGKKAAQIMIITGAEEGKIKDFPNWETNLNFAVKLQNKAETMYRGLMKPIFFAPRKYNMDLTPYSLLLEIGSDANTIEEAVYSAGLIGEVLAGFLQEF